MLREDGKIQRCQAIVYKADVPRYDGRGPGGFSMHYNAEQCSFKAVEETKNTDGNKIKLCSKHLRKVSFICMSPCNWDFPWEPRKNKKATV